MIRLFFTVLFLALFLVFSKAQDGTTVSSDQQAYEAGSVDSVNSLYELDRTFHIVLHLVKNISGNPNVNFGDLETALDGLNVAFDEIGVDFVLHDTNYIDNYQFNTIVKGSSRENMLTSEHVVKNVLNLYLVANLKDGSAQDICGYTYMPGDSLDHIFIRKDCLQPEIFARQFGHFFNLYNNHESAFGEESVARVDCQDTGDRCCDTPADPNLNSVVNGNCQYVGAAQEGGDYYVPNATNYMSNAPLTCRCYYSPCQYLRMINAMVSVKSYLW